MNTKYLIPQSFITTSDFNRLAKRMFDARIKEAARLFVNKSHVNNAFDIADKNREKIKKSANVWFKSFYW